MIKTYALLTKPGIIMGNLITVVGGFMLATTGRFEPLLFLTTLMGLGLVIASACVFNNYIDRTLDQKMERTKNRILAQGHISHKKALLFATLLGIFGTFSLYFLTNLLATLLALAGFFIYVILYSFWKSHSRYATAVGSLAGAIPPVVGYVAVTNRFDVGALLLLLLLIFWQMPHFFAIALCHFEDYQRAQIPTLPVTKGIKRTKIHMLLYIVAFMVCSLLFTYLGYTGLLFLIVACLSGLLWLTLSLSGFRQVHVQKWGRKMFHLSLLVITLLMGVMALPL